MRLQEMNLLPPELLVEKMHFSSAHSNALAMYDLGLYIKKTLSTDVSRLLFTQKISVKSELIFFILLDLFMEFVIVM